MSTLTDDPSATQACPFCGLLCDDLLPEQLTIERLSELSCDKARNGFRNALAQTGNTPRIRGKAVSLDEAISEAALILARAKQPLIAGLGTDVAGMQALMPLAEKLGAITDHMNSGTRRINTAAMQDTPGVYTTFAEARHRADLVVLCAGDMLSSFPRLFERVLPAEGEFLEGKPRKFASLGDEITHRSYEVKHPHVKLSASLPCMPNNFIDMVSALHCELQAKPHTLQNNKAIATLAAQLKAARYPVFVWSATTFSQAHADLSVRALLALINTLNVKGRAAALMLGGSAGDATTEAVHLWQSGSPWGSRFSRGVVRHEPQRTNAAELLANNEVDAMLWIDAFGTVQYPSASTHIPTVVFSSLRIYNMADVSIPVGVSGVDHASQLFRGDRVVVMPFNGLNSASNSALKREGTAASVAQVVKLLLNALEKVSE